MHRDSHAASFVTAVAAIALAGSCGASSAIPSSEAGLFDARASGTDRTVLPTPDGLVGDPTVWTAISMNAGDTWGCYGVMLAGSIPNTDTILAGISADGIWASHDAGNTWSQLGTPGQISNRPYEFVYDPADVKTFWVSGNYGDCLFVTHDGGATFTHLGTLTHCDSVAVDFTDPQRKTLLLGMHEQAQALEKSTDGGNTWTNIGTNLPANSNFSNNFIMYDANHYVVATAGWLSGASWGIYTTSNGGSSFSNVDSSDGPGSVPFIASDGTIYWNTLWGGDLITSTDRGATWKSLCSPVTAMVTELPDGRIVGPSANQLYASADHGATWSPLGPPLPIKPLGVVYNAYQGIFVIWQMGGDKTNSIYRWPYRP